MDDEFTLTFVTCASQEEAERIGEALVTEKLAACVSIVPGVTSIYFWQGKLCKETERLLLIKSRAARSDAMSARIRALHSYTVPEIVNVRIAAGNPAYLNWVREATR